MLRVEWRDRTSSSPSTDDKNMVQTASLGILLDPARLYPLGMLTERSALSRQAEIEALELPEAILALPISLTLQTQKIMR